MWRRTRCIRRNRRLRHFVFTCLFICCSYLYWAHDPLVYFADYLFARSYKTDFDYPLNIDLKPIVRRILDGKGPGIEPINYYPYEFLSHSGACKTVESLDLFIVVKSAMNNFGHREAVRQTFGQEKLMPGKKFKALFFLGIDESLRSETQQLIKKEMAEYKDIIQISFRDTYFNGTIKIMMSFRWVLEHCPNADFYLFTDDDMYISLYNLFDYVRGKDGGTPLLAGTSLGGPPDRCKYCKWRLSLDEYPWDYFPPYLAGGAFIVSNIAMKFLYAGSLFVKHFKIDDVFIGIVAQKVGIMPVNCSRMYSSYNKKDYDKEGYRDVISSHGYEDHEELLRVWHEQHNITRT